MVNATRVNGADLYHTDMVSQKLKPQTWRFYLKKLS